MSAQNPMLPDRGSYVDTANDRFKGGFRLVFWLSVTIAALLHFLFLELFPALEARDYRRMAEAIPILELPQEIEIPPPPEKIARPALPVVAQTELEDDVTIAPTRIEDNPIVNAPPPLPTTAIERGPTFTPYEVAPRLRNEAEIRRMLEREYPPLLRDAGVGGVVVMWFYISNAGKVLQSQVHQSSGHESLDRLAQRLAPHYEFTPARNMDRNVAVWIQMPIRFLAR